MENKRDLICVYRIEYAEIDSSIYYFHFIVIDTKTKETLIEDDVVGVDDTVREQKELVSLYERVNKQIVCVINEPYELTTIKMF